jgi:hypothetical protein
MSDGKNEEAEKPKRLSPGGSKIFSRLPPMSIAQKKCASQHTPFRDIEPPGFEPREYKPAAVRVARKKVDDGSGPANVEWRGQIPGGGAAFQPTEETEVMI